MQDEHKSEQIMVEDKQENDDIVAFMKGEKINGK